MKRLSAQDDTSTATTNVNITSGSITGITDLAVADGGTGASTLTGIVKGNGTSAFTAVTAPSGTIVGTSDTQTLTNKRIEPRVGTTTSSATPTINTDNVDMYGLTAQAADITSFTTNLSGTPVNGQKLWIYIVGTAARAITWGASFEASTVALPTTTVSTDRLDVGFVWNAATSKWRCVASGQLMAVSFVNNALGGTADTTSFSITLPATEANDILILEYTHRGTGDATLGGTSITTGGLTWTEKHDQQYATSTFSGKTVWTRASGNHTGQTITGSGLTNATAAIVTIYRGAVATGDPLTAATIVGEQNASGNETQAEITTTVNGAWVVLVVANSPDVAISNQACTSPGTLTERAERLSTGGTDASIAHASDEKTTAGATGAFTWSQTDGASGSWAYAIKPELSPTTTLNSPANASSSSDTTPTLDFTGTDGNGDSVEYEVQIDTVDTFDSQSGLQISHTTNDGTVGLASGNGGTNEAAGQSFTTSAAFDAVSIDLRLSKSGAPTDDLVVSIRSTSETGTVLGSASINGTALTTSEALYNLEFTAPVSLSASTTYYITCERTGAFSSSVFYRIRGSLNDTYAGGTLRNKNSGSWTQNTGRDLYFSLYSDPTPLLSVVSGSVTTFNSTSTWVAPADGTVNVKAWGGGGGGGGANNGTASGGGGGGGGAYSEETTFSVTKDTSYTVTVGAGGSGGTNANGTDGGDSWFNSTGTVLAKGGVKGTISTPGQGGAGGASGSGVGDTKTSGGNGGNGATGAGTASGGSGGSGGDTTGGGNGGNGSGSTGGTAGAAGTTNGAAGVAGTNSANGTNGIAPGSGGSGASNGTLSTGGNGADGRVIVDFTASGFVNPDNGSDTHPFNSGENIQYTVQAGDALAVDTYHWRVRAKDPSGSNTYGAWSSTRSFDVTSAGGANTTNFFRMF